MSVFPLPIPSTPLIGREREIASASRLLVQPNVRLVTLTGPGGTGKTRLSLAIAVELHAAFRDGVFFVSLAPISDPDLVISAIAHALNLNEASNQSLAQRLVSYLRDKQMLLVLDNFEQVITAGTQVSALLNEALQLKMLVTSRASLRLSAEREFPVPQLQLPDLQKMPTLDAISANDAVTLFAVRAQAVKPDFQLNDGNLRAIAEVCIRLDGLPLAIELAAARIKLLSPQALLTRLGDRLSLLTGGMRDGPLRQQTLRNTIDWSYQLLGREEQQLFVCLAVFVGGWTLEAAEIVCDGQESRLSSVLDGLQSLVDNSLLRQTEDDDGTIRFEMLETIREYALELLEQSSSQKHIRRQHAAYYLAFAEAAEWELTRTHRVMWLRRIKAEYGNLLAALKWSRYQQGADADFGLLLAGALAQYWEARGFLYEGRAWLNELLMLRGDQGNAQASNEQPYLAQAARARGLYGAGVLAHSLGNIATADTELSESVTIFRDLGDKHRLAAALLSHGRVVWQTGATKRSLEFYEEALQLARGLGDQWIIADALYEIGSYWHSHGDLALARSEYESSLRICRQLKYTRGTSSALAALGEVAARQGDVPAARTYYQETLTLLRELEDKADVAWSLQMLSWSMYSISDRAWIEDILHESLALFQVVDDRLGLAWALNRLGDFHRWQSHDKQAEEYYNKSLAAFRELGHIQGVASVLHNLGYIALHRNDVQQAKQWFQESLATFNELDHKWSCADCFAGLAAVAVAIHQPDLAARFLGAAEAIHRSIDPSGTLLEPPNRAEWDHTVSAVRALLDPPTLSAEWAAGQAMSLEQVIAYGLHLPFRELAVQPINPASQQVSRSAAPNALTERELEVLRLVATGMTNPEIAAQLVISPRTVNAHLNSIYGKLGVATRSAATRYALEHGLTQ